MQTSNNNNGGKINDSARVAGISCRQLNKLMNKYGIRKEEFKVSGKLHGPDLPMRLIADFSPHHLQRIADNNKCLRIDVINQVF